MPLSGSVDFTLTAREVITFALKKINVLGLGAVSLPAHEAEAARIQLNLMLKTWQVTGPHLWKKAEAALPLTAATQSYSLTAINPLRIVAARYRSADGNDLPMEPMTRDEYYNLPRKGSVGVPTQYYFDPQRSTQTLYVWGTHAAVTTETIEYTYQKRIDDIDDIANEIDVPQEWLETVGLSLAARLADDKGLEGRAIDRVIARSEGLLRAAIDYEREDCVTIGYDYEG